MAEPHVISALKVRRGEIAAHIHDLEKRVARQRSALAHIDATLLLFNPDLDIDAIPPKRRYKRTRYFAFGELARRCVDVLRDAGKPMSSREISREILAAKGWAVADTNLRALVAEMALPVLRRLVKRGTVLKTGVSRDARWGVVS